MRALILCAGKGTRLKPITDTIPKVMVRVGGKPVLERLVDHLHNFGITEIIVNLHHLPEKIYKHFGTRLLYFYEPKLLGEEETEKRLANWLGDRYIVMNGDTLTDINFDNMTLAKMSARSFENDVYTGTKYVHNRVTTHQLKVDFYCYWQDMGTHEGLEKAREYYKKGGKRGFKTKG